MITVSGRPVARLGPTSRNYWVSGQRLAAVWKTPAPTTMSEDLADFPGELSDPFS